MNLQLQRIVKLSGEMKWSAAPEQLLAAAICVMLLVRVGKIEYVDFDNKPVFDIVKADSSRD